MDVTTITAKPESEAVEPTILFDVVLAFQQSLQFPLNVAAIVRTEDKKILGVAHAMPTKLDNLQLDANDSSNYINISSPFPLALTLTAKQIDYLEVMRSKHRKRDVILTCEVIADFLVSATTLAYLKPGEPIKDSSGATVGQVVVYSSLSPGERFYSQSSNLWVLSGNGGRAFLKRETLQKSLIVTINSSDWVHDYSSLWNGTQYLVIELPQPEVLTSSAQLEERVNTAIAAAKRASENLLKGEWNDVLEDLRPVWELLRNEANVHDLLSRDGYPPDAITAFNESIKFQFEFASKFVHSLDRAGKKVLPAIQAKREDAYVCYSFAMSLLNLVSRKAVRLADS